MHDGVQIVVLTQNLRAAVAHWLACFSFCAAESSRGPGTELQGSGTVNPQLVLERPRFVSCPIGTMRHSQDHNVN